jgi:uncharacterized membrane protein
VSDNAWPVPTTPKPTEAEANLRLLTHAMYAMHTISWLTWGFLSLVAIIINYVKRDALPSDFYRTHFRWQSRSFWFTLMWLVITSPLWLLFVFPGWAAWGLIGLWYLYRFIRGWWNFFEGRPMPIPPI